MCRIILALVNYNLVYVFNGTCRGRSTTLGLLSVTDQLVSYCQIKTETPIEGKIGKGKVLVYSSHLTYRCLRKKQRSSSRSRAAPCYSIPEGDIGRSPHRRVTGSNFEEFCVRKVYHTRGQFLNNFLDDEVLVL